MTPKPPPKPRSRVSCVERGAHSRAVPMLPHGGAARQTDASQCMVEQLGPRGWSSWAPSIRGTSAKHAGACLRGTFGVGGLAAPSIWSANWRTVCSAPVAVGSAGAGSALRGQLVRPGAGRARSGRPLGRCLFALLGHGLGGVRRQCSRRRGCQRGGSSRRRPSRHSVATSRGGVGQVVVEGRGAAQ